MKRRALAVFLACCCPSSAGVRDTVATPVVVARRPEPRPEAPPTGRLPADVRPTRAALELTIAPDQERFSGSTRITVTIERERSVLWLHGQGLTVTEATVQAAGGPPLVARWEQVDEHGLAALRLPEPVGPGQASIAISWNAPFGEPGAGLFKVEVGERPYAFTQFEALWARRALPCFDEPAFKIPWDVSLTVRASDVAIGNTMPTGEETLAGGRRRVRFGTTEPLPTYLLAWAVGELDVVDGRPLAPSALRTRAVPLRGVAVRGRGTALRGAMDEMARTLEALEQYFAIPYPYEKLDVIAVPEFGDLAMENAGAVTFGETLLLLDPVTATEEQRRDVFWVMAHEFAHQWFGNLVTMPWWDDIWLNEGFATWMEARVGDVVHPEYHRGLSLLASIHEAMAQDGLISARRVRQPIESHDDIEASFDGITYQKGAATISMFERWIGAEAFQRGIRRYLEAHRFGAATSADLLASLTEVAGRDVAAPMATFLEQGGVPLVEARTDCEAAEPGLVLHQSRWLPVGSTGDPQRIWQIPVCARYETDGQLHETCTLLTETEGRLDLEGDHCPTWVMPNADAAGYYRWSLPAAELAKLQTPAVWSKLTVRERLSYAENVRVAYAGATATGPEVFGRLDAIARDAERRVAHSPFDLIAFARDHVADDALRPAVEAFGRKLYAPALRRLGWQARAGRTEDGETRLARQALVEFLALQGRDPAVRSEAARRGRAYAPPGQPLRPDAMDLELADVALAVAVQEGDAAFFDSLRTRLGTETDAVVRHRILSALGHATQPDLARRALAFTLDPSLHADEVSVIVWALMAQRETRDLAWPWLKENFATLAARAGGFESFYFPWLISDFCDTEHAADARAFFGARVEAMPGSARHLEQALEVVNLCAARVAAQGASTREFFARR